MFIVSHEEKDKVKTSADSGIVTLKEFYSTIVKVMSFLRKLILEGYIPKEISAAKNLLACDIVPIPAFRVKKISIDSDNSIERYKRYIFNSPGVLTFGYKEHTDESLKIGRYFVYHCRNKFICPLCASRLYSTLRDQLHESIDLLDALKENRFTDIKEDDKFKPPILRVTKYFQGKVTDENVLAKKVNEFFTSLEGKNFRYIMVTFTASHLHNVNLRQFAVNFNGAVRKFKSDRWYKFLKKIDSQGTVTVTEVTDDDPESNRPKSGWHWHKHTLIAYTNEISDSDLTVFELELQSNWKKCLRSYNLNCRKEVGFKFSIFSNSSKIKSKIVSSYLSKINFLKGLSEMKRNSNSISHEISGAFKKSGRQGRLTNFQLILRAYQDQDSVYYLNRVRELFEGIHRMHGYDFTGIFNILLDMSDKFIPPEGPVYAWRQKEYNVVTAHDAHYDLLDQAKAAKFESIVYVKAAMKYLESIKGDSTISEDNVTHNLATIDHEVSTEEEFYDESLSFEIAILKYKKFMIEQATSRLNHKLIFDPRIEIKNQSRYAFRDQILEDGTINNFDEYPDVTLPMLYEIAEKKSKDVTDVTIEDLAEYYGTLRRVEREQIASGVYEIEDTLDIEPEIIDPPDLTEEELDELFESQRQQEITKKLKDQKGIIYAQVFDELQRQTPNAMVSMDAIEREGKRRFEIWKHNNGYA